MFEVNELTQLHHMLVVQLETNGWKGKFNHDNRFGFFTTEKDGWVRWKIDWQIYITIFNPNRFDYEWKPTFDSIHRIDFDTCDAKKLTKDEFLESLANDIK